MVLVKLFMVFSFSTSRRWSSVCSWRDRRHLNKNILQLSNARSGEDSLLPPRFSSLTRPYGRRGLPSLPGEYEVFPREPWSLCANPSNRAHFQFCSVVTGMRENREKLQVQFGVLLLLKQCCMVQTFQFTNVTWLRSCLSAAMLSSDRQNASSSSHITSISKLVSGSCSRSPMHIMMSFLMVTNSWWRHSWK